MICFVLIIKHLQNIIKNKAGIKSVVWSVRAQQFTVSTSPPLSSALFFNVAKIYEPFYYNH